MIKKGIITTLLMILVPIFCLTSFNCAHLNYNESNLIREKRKSVVKISGHTTIEISVTSTSASHSAELEADYTGTGAIIKHEDDVSFILTAAHVCGHLYEDQIKKFFFFYDKKDPTMRIKANTAIIATDIDGNRHAAIQLVMHPPSDSCVFISTRIDQPASEISSFEPLIGERSYNLALPRGIWGRGFIPAFEGFFLGELFTDPDRDVAASYSIPTAPGSSGSPIYNAYGDIIGMVHSYYRSFDHLALAATHEQISWLADIADEAFEKNAERYNRILKSLQIMLDY